MQFLASEALFCNFHHQPGRFVHLNELQLLKVRIWNRKASDKFNLGDFHLAYSEILKSYNAWLISNNILSSYPTI